MSTGQKASAGIEAPVSQPSVAPQLTGWYTRRLRAAAKELIDEIERTEREWAPMCQALESWASSASAGDAATEVPLQACDTVTVREDV